MLTILFHNTRTDTIYDISNIVSSANISTKAEEQPSSVTLDVVNRDKMEFPSGSVLSVKSGQTPLFLGYLFKQEGDEEGKLTLTFYDQLKYLQYKDTLALGNKTLGDLFSQICTYKGLKHRVVNNVPYNLPVTLYEDKTLYDMLKDMIDNVYATQGKKFIIWDNFGVLELRDVMNLRQNLFFGDGSMLLSYSYGQSIDDEVYNIVKLMRENSETKEFEEVVEMDKTTIRYWGQLQHFAKVDENVGDLRTHAKNLLKVHNREERTLTLECMGDLRVRAGVGIIVELDALKKTYGGARYYMVEECTHNIEDKHTMTLKLAVM